MPTLAIDESASPGGPSLHLMFLTAGLMTATPVAVDFHLLQNRERIAPYSGRLLSDVAAHPESSRDQTPYPLRSFLRSPFAVDYKARIEQLDGYLKEDELALDPNSESDFWSLMESMLFTRKAGLVLLEDGTLRAIWKDDRGNRLALLFHGNKTVQYVVFVRRSDTTISRQAGTIALDKTQALIEQYGLTALVQQV